MGFYRSLDESAVHLWATLPLKWAGGFFTGSYRGTGLRNVGFPDRNIGRVPLGYKTSGLFGRGFFGGLGYATGYALTGTARGLGRAAIWAGGRAFRATGGGGGLATGAGMAGGAVLGAGVAAANTAVNAYRLLSFGKGGAEGLRTAAWNVIGLYGAGAIARGAWQGYMSTIPSTYVGRPSSMYSPLAQSASGLTLALRDLAR